MKNKENKLREILIINLSLSIPLILVLLQSMYLSLKLVESLEVPALVLLTGAITGIPFLLLYIRWIYLNMILLFDEVKK